MAAEPRRLRPQEIEETSRSEEETVLRRAEETSRSEEEEQRQAEETSQSEEETDHTLFLVTRRPIYLLSS